MACDLGDDVMTIQSGDIYTLVADVEVADTTVPSGTQVTLIEPDPNRLMFWLVTSEQHGQFWATGEALGVAG